MTWYVVAMAIDLDKPIYKAQEQEDEEKYLPYQLDHETVYLIQFACRAVLFSVFLSLYAAAVVLLFQGIAFEDGWLFAGGVLFGAAVGCFHVKARDASRKW